MKKIWTSELSVYDKHVAHNTFAAFVLISTFGILGWTIREIEHINKKTKNALYDWEFSMKFSCRLVTFTKKTL